MLRIFKKIIKKLALKYTLGIIIILKGRTDMNNKKLGFGLMRLPALDPDDPAKIDIIMKRKSYCFY